MARQAEELRIHPRRQQGPHLPRLHRRKIERLGQRREGPTAVGVRRVAQIIDDQRELAIARARVDEPVDQGREALHASRSEEHTSELQSLMRISYAVFCLKKKKNYYNRVELQQTIQ